MSAKLCIAKYSNTLYCTILNVQELATKNKTIKFDQTHNIVITTTKRANSLQLTLQLTDKANIDSVDWNHTAVAQIKIPLNEEQQHAVEFSKRKYAAIELPLTDKFEITFDIPPFAGFFNIGETCYFNVACQLLYHATKFRELVRTMDTDNPIKKLFNQVSSTNQAIDPSDFLFSFDWPKIHIITIQNDAMVSKY